MKTGERVRERCQGSVALCFVFAAQGCRPIVSPIRRVIATASIGLTLSGQLLDDSSGASKYWFPTRGCLQTVVRGWNLAESGSDAVQVEKLMVVGRCGGEVGYESMEK